MLCSLLYGNDCGRLFIILYGFLTKMNTRRHTKIVRDGHYNAEVGADLIDTDEGGSPNSGAFYAMRVYDSAAEAHLTKPARPNGLRPASARDSSICKSTAKAARSPIFSRRPPTPNIPTAIGRAEPFL